MNAVIRCALGAVLFALASTGATDEQPPPLTEKQKDMIRRVCERGPGFSVTGRPDLPPLRRFVVIDPDLADCHKANRLGTLLFLEKIVETGKPQEVVYAITWMEAL